MKNKRGFTLIEAIGIVTILALMLLLVVPSITKTLKRNEQKKYNGYLNNLKSATESYIVEKLKEEVVIGDEYYVTLGNLIDTKFIRESIKNPENDGVLSRETKIKVTKNLDGTRYYTIQPHYLLPETYTLVDYIESNGTQYIDTKVIPNSITTLKLELSFSDYNESSSARSFVGVQSLDESAFSVAFAPSYSNTLNVFIDRTDDVEILDVTDEIIANQNQFTLENGSVNYGDQNGILTSKTTTHNTSLIVFGVREDDSITPFSTYDMQLYGFEIYDDNDMIRDFVPCYRNSDNQVGLFDLVNFVFYTNKGTGTFEYGE
ncbi:MAG: type II secretion system protein [Firmicutes bacterium]|nr:type II secretion system protein [Bacillota bacterium]